MTTYKSLAFGMETLDKLEKGLGCPPYVNSMDKASLSTEKISPSEPSRSTWFRSKFDALAKWLSSKSKGTNPNPRRPDMEPSKCLDDVPDGYPKVAHFQNSDDAYMIFRRFGCVFSRLILYKQDELKCLEQTMQDLDELDHETEGWNENLKSRELDEHREPETIPGESRKKLMSQMEAKAIEYAKLIKHASNLVAMNRPEKADHQSVFNFMMTLGEPQLCDDEGQFIRQKDDLISLRPGRDDAWLDRMVEKTLRLLPVRVAEFIFCSPDDIQKSKDTRIHYFSPSRIRKCVTLILTAIILFLLITPVYLLFKLSLSGDITSNPMCIGVLIVFTLIFSTVISLFTKAKRHELLAASAGYCAVLVVFLGNVGNIGLPNH